jgi:ParB family chromosome partitioning protein
VKKKNTALGKGAAALFGNLQNLEPEENKKKLALGQKKEEPFINDSPYLVDIDLIDLNPHQPRKIFKEKLLDELAISIKENGVIQPIVLSRSEDDGRFVLIAGERRLKACKRLKMSKVPVIIKRATEKEKMVMAIIENVQRSDLNCVEEGLAYYKLMSEFNLTQDDVSKKLGKERSTIANFLRILKLPREVISLLQKELLSFGHAKVLAAQKDRERLIYYANLAVEEEYSIRELEKELKKKNIIKDMGEAQEDNSKERLEHLRKSLERKTGFHFCLKSKKNGVGQFLINFNNEAEFNDIYEYLIEKRI